MVLSYTSFFKGIQFLIIHSSGIIIINFKTHLAVCHIKKDSLGIVTKLLYLTCYVAFIEREVVSRKKYREQVREKEKRVTIIERKEVGRFRNKSVCKF